MRVVLRGIGVLPGGPIPLPRAYPARCARAPFAERKGQIAILQLRSREIRLLSGKWRIQDDNLKRFARKMRNNPTDVEFALWQRLRTRRLDGYRFVRQYVIDGAIVDFACPHAKLAIELDGGQHDERRALDDLRTEQLNRAGYKVVRFWNNEITSNIEGVLIVIREALRARK